VTGLAKEPVPLIGIDVIEGRSDAELKAPLDTAHPRARGFKVPAQRSSPDRAGAQAFAHDRRMGLGIERTDKVVVVHVTNSVNASISG
jgi:hypothetical protein